MGKNKRKSSKKPTPTQLPVSDTNNQETERKFVNLLYIYAIYKQRLRRITQDELCLLINFQPSTTKPKLISLCKELMKAKGIPDRVGFQDNVGYLSPVRLQPILALVAARSQYKMSPWLVSFLNFDKTPRRFQETFSNLMVYGFWFLGRVIQDSLSPNENLNRGNTFNFVKGDMGFWWAGVIILDWVYYITKIITSRKKENKNKRNTSEYLDNCYSFSVNDHPGYRFYSNRAVVNMNKHPMYFLTSYDWKLYSETIQTIRHQSHFVYTMHCVSPENLYKTNLQEGGEMVKIDEVEYRPVLASIPTPIIETENLVDNDNVQNLSRSRSQDPRVSSDFQEPQHRSLSPAPASLHSEQSTDTASELSID